MATYPEIQAWVKKEYDWQPKTCLPASRVPWRRHRRRSKGPGQARPIRLDCDTGGFDCLVITFSPAGLAISLCLATGGDLRYADPANQSGSSP